MVSGPPDALLAARDLRADAFAIQAAVPETRDAFVRNVSHHRPAALSNGRLPDMRNTSSTLVRVIDHPMRRAQKALLAKPFGCVAALLQLCNVTLTARSASALVAFS